MKTATHQTSTRAVRLVAAALLCGISGLLPAQDAPGTPPAEPPDETAGPPPGSAQAAHLAAKFTALAGSEENAAALVTGLRGGTAVTLTSTVDGQTVTTEFQPATGELGNGNAAISLALAQQSLSKAGITQPTPEQLVTALNGGTVTGSDGTPTTLAGVLTLRAAGQGWGDIAQTLGVKLGPAMRQLHAANPGRERPDRPGEAVKAERAVRGAEVKPRPATAFRPEGPGARRGGGSRLPLPSRPARRTVAPLAWSSPRLGPARPPAAES